MKDSITIKIKNVSRCMDWLIGIEGGVLIIWGAILFVCFNWISLTAFVLMLALTVYHVIVINVPTVVTADGEKVQYKNFFGLKEILLTDINNLSCEQYSVSLKGRSNQYIKLVVSTSAGKDIEFHDEVDTSQMVDDFIKKRKSEIPMVQLYNFLKRNTDIT